MLALEEFAHNLLCSTLTTDRVAEVMARMAGERITVGPLRFGPGGSVGATGEGVIGRIRVTRSSPSDDRSDPRQPLSFGATIPGELTIDLTAGSGGRPYRYQGTVVVPLRIGVLLEAPAWVVLDVNIPLRPRDVTVRLRTSGMTTFVLQTLGDADHEVATQVAAVVNERVAAVADLLRIDLAHLLDQAWNAEMHALAWATPRPTDRTLSGDARDHRRRGLAVQSAGVPAG